MDAAALLNISQVLLIAILVFVAINLYLVFRLKDIDPFRKWDPDKINGTLFLLFFVVGLPVSIVATMNWSDTFTLLIHPASEHGAEIDRMHINTMIVAILVSVVTNLILFYFSWRYRYDKDNKALYYPHNNRLEIIWTAVPAVVLTLLVFDGVGVWHDIWKEIPEDQEVVNIEVNGKQFGWTARYPGEDLTFGETNIGFISEADGNALGFNKEDEKGFDDLVVQELHLPVNKLVHIDIKSRDVLHSMTLAHFRVKMDAVPGMPTYFNFTPTITTDSMRTLKQNPDFNYEMSCQQICGGGHWNMRLIVVVESEEDYNKWLKEQKTFAQFYKELNGVDLIAQANGETETTEPSSEDGEGAEGENETEATGEVAMVK
ncbi:MAG: cytochrome c oxidase subunit II [Bacteroidia bacterium]|nr:cytochrome c oxidase subunit II [Bacteroidia bacterium]